jgi:glyceraldehyde 3-phosphate dehydrogenase
MSLLSDKALTAWTTREALAEAMIPLIGTLYRDNNVVTSVYGRSLINQSVVGLLKTHRFARHVDDVELSLEETLPLLQELAQLELGACAVDLAKLNLRYRQHGNGTPLADFLRTDAPAPTSYCTVSGASADCWPASWWSTPVEDRDCACAPSWSAADPNRTW